MKNDLVSTASRVLNALAVEMEESGKYTIASDIRESAKVLTKRIAKLEREVDWRKFYVDEVREMVEIATPYFQCGGKYADWLPLGSSITRDGFKALVERYEASEARLASAPRAYAAIIDGRVIAVAQREDYVEYLRKVHGDAVKEVAVVVIEKQ